MQPTFVKRTVLLLCLTFLGKTFNFMCFFDYIYISSMLA
ncbi:hypothetical protein I600_2732 [Maribacter dokdonensis DSW-8]|nr:hypothetical protein I600_2732 [Maribacter dokdonensis DSW-8]